MEYCSDPLLIVEGLHWGPSMWRFWYLTERRRVSVFRLEIIEIDEIDGDEIEEEEGKEGDAPNAPEVWI